jgi:flavorubredoxin
VNNWLAAAPRATAAHGRIGCAIWLADAADRPPRALADGEWLDLGGKSVQRIDTPHVPHSWDAGLLYEKTTGTLFCSDLFTHLGDPPALTEGDIVGPAIAAEESFHFTSLTPSTGATMRRLAALEPKRLAVMHGSSFSGNAKPVLEALADYYDGLLKQAIA